ncbi:uroporphyrinogen decarboxylase family protein [Desulfoluna sp.]|uniref:uroporphyrinogen decarboxylase family protein n=1 Tax=Desulfoluna sp. TaxID=2045199 RepID=UPI0026332330|nr:uroporphyrinogen decarboxylase family protein [Desulfoluna sp.]
MNSMERVLAALQGRKRDRRAVTLTLSLYGAKLTGCPLKEYYTSPQAYLKGQQAVIEHCRPDILFTPFVLTAEAEAFGSEIVYLAKSPPNLRKPVIRHGREMASLPDPDMETHPRLRYLRESTRLLAEASQGTRPVAGLLLSPVDLPALIMGIDGWLETLLFDPENTRRTLEKTTRFFVRWANTLVAEGADLLVIPSMFSHPKILTPNILETTVMPALTEAFQEVNAPLVFHHGGNPLSTCMGLYDDLPNVAAFALDDRDSFADVREQIGREKLLMGNINGPNLWRLTPEEIRTACRALLDDRADDDRFVIATAGADVAYDTPLENITTLVEAVESFG